jgi:general secretion pathway protein H
MESRQLRARPRSIRSGIRLAGRRGTRGRGFTLIELLVVLLLLTITLGLIGLNLGNDNTDRVREEASRLTALLQAARDEAILQGQVLAVQFNADGYRFLRVDAKGQLKPLEQDESFRPRQLPEGMTLTVEIDSVPAQGEAGMILDPSGQMPPFTLTLHLGEAAWQTHYANGRIRSGAPGSEHAG